MIFDNQSCGETGVLFSDNPEDLRLVRESGMLLTVLTQNSPLGVLQCLHDFDVAAQYPDFMRLKGGVRFAYDQLPDLGLQVFQAYVDGLRALYQEHIRKGHRLNIDASRADYSGQTGKWHRDENPVIGPDVTGLCIFNTNVENPEDVSGQFTFASRPDVGYFDASLRGPLEYSVRAFCDFKGHQVPLGQLALFKNGKKEGLIHKSTKPRGGVRWRVQIVPA